VAAVHGVFEMYDLDKDGRLKVEELRPFFINFNQLVIGMAADLANDSETL
jgi:hypothetical protein